MISMIEKIKNKYNWLIVLAFSFISSFGIYLHLFDFSQADAKKIVWLLLFVFCIIVLKKAFGIKGKREKRASLILSFLFSGILVLGTALNTQSDLGGLIDGFLATMRTIITFSGLAVILYAFLIIIFDFINKRNFLNQKEIGFFTSNLRSFFVVWGVIFACWLPYFIIAYPAVTSYDSFNQLQQILGQIPLSNWHPVLHTFYTSIFINIGMAVGSLSFGIALYIISQMIILSAIFSFSLYYLAKLRLNNKFRLIILLYYILPLNAIYSVTMWKDILFGGLTLLMVIYLIEIAQNPEKSLSSWKKLLGFFALSLLFCLFRNNGIHIMLVFLPILLLMSLKYWKQILAVGLLLFICTGVFKGPVFKAMNIEDSPITESLSVPLQQIARTVVNHRDKLTDEEVQTIKEIFYGEDALNKLQEVYNPRLSDPVKGLFDLESFSNDKGRYFALWLNLGLKYPATYVESFLCNNYGYWFPDVDYWITMYDVNNGNAIYGNMDTFEKDFGVVNKPLIGGVDPLLPRYINKGLQRIPVFSMTYSIGFMIWIAIFGIALCFLRKRKRMLIPFIFLGCFWLTILASPVHAEYRYVFGIMISVPVCLGTVLLIVQKPDAEKLQ